MVEKGDLVDVVLTHEGKVVEKAIKEYVNRRDDEPSEIVPFSEKPFWDTVHEGTKKLVEERPELLKHI